MRRYFTIIFILTFAFALSSCGARKKATNGVLSHKSKNSKNVVITDASDARNLEFSSNKLKNYAVLLGVSEKEMKNKDLYREIDEWMGTPHRLGGLDKRGIDCSAFVGILYRDAFGTDLPRTSRDMADVVKRKYERQLKEGDLVFFSFSGRNVDHVGIYLHNGKFVHVSTRKGVIISSLNDVWYSKYLTKCGTPVR